MSKIRHQWKQMTRGFKYKNRSSLYVFECRSCKKEVVGHRLPGGWCYTKKGDPAP